MVFPFFVKVKKKRGLGTSPRFLNKKRSRSEDLAFLFKIWDVGHHILILPDKNVCGAPHTMLAREKRAQKSRKEHKGNCPFVPQGVDRINVFRDGKFLGFTYKRHTRQA